MGDVDTSVKDFIKLDSVFSQLFSQGVYGGKMSIDPGKLQEFDTAIQETVRLENGEVKMVERFRDAQKIARIFDDKIAFQIIMGVEGQTGVHYYMPVRCMELDALTYSYQCKKISEKTKEDKELKKYSDGVPKGTRILPTVTLVFYTGSRPWDGPFSVYDMLNIPEDMKEWVKQTTPDYRMNLIDVRHMSDEEIDKFKGDLRAFLLMVRERFDREKLKTAVAIHRETWYALSKIKNDKRYVEYIDSVSDEELKGGVYMDAALDYIEAVGKAEGKAEGIAEGKAEGIAEGKAEGKEEGKANINKLGILLLKAGRQEDFLKSLSDEVFQRKLLIEFGIEKES